MAAMEAQFSIARHDYNGIRLIRVTHIRSTLVFSVWLPAGAVVILVISQKL